MCETEQAIHFYILIEHDVCDTVVTTKVWPRPPSCDVLKAQIANAQQFNAWLQRRCRRQS